MILNFAKTLGFTIAVLVALVPGNAIFEALPVLLTPLFVGRPQAADAETAERNAIHSTPKDYGAKGDALVLTDGAMSSGSAVFTSGSAHFSARDVGKAIAVTGAGTGGNALVAFISVVNNATNVTLSAKASATVSHARADYGTDDTAAVRSCIERSTMLGGRCTINDEMRFMLSNTSTTIHISGTKASGGTIDGKGTLIFAPQETLTGAANDRLFYAASSEAAGPFQVRTGPIAAGGTSFSAQNPGDAAQLSKGDWIIITEKDGGATDVIYSDWFQVAGVMGTTVNIVGHFRMAFPNGRPFNTSGAPAACVVASPCGLSFRKLSNVVQSLTIKDINIVVPKIFSSNGAIGIATRDTRGVQIRNVTCYDASALCFAGFLDQGLVFSGNHIGSAVYPEFAGEVDAAVSGNHIDPSESGGLGSASPQTGGMLIDFGTGFSRFEGNTIGNHLQTCITLLSGVHDVTITGNTCGRTSFGTGAACILLRGSYRNTVERNVCVGGDGASVGITVADSTGFTSNITSSANSVKGNTVKGYASPYDVRSAKDRLEIAH